MFCLAKMAKVGKLVALVGCLALSVLPVHASVTETREYVVWVDGKEVKRLQLSIVVQDDQSMTLSSWVGNSSTSVISATESWKNNRLQSLKVHATDKKADVSAVAEGNRMRVRVNGQERLLKNELWTTNYWKLADAKFHDKSVPVLDVDTGKDSSRFLHYISADELKIGDQMVRCYHFRVVGGPTPVDVWFDVHHIMVRQEYLEAGRRTIVQLASLQR